ncbi:unnamed protein product [Mytilus coruscus]|uniref:Uncharacterized protein n=1 Tax=Mytilus coruscus TaxID=42192 RepID=A0A6J8E1B9_MYTCO|nr:unnamed protein product [Mytilus coruscus]
MSSFPVMIAGHSQAKGNYFDLAPYKRALLTTPIPALPPAPTPKVSSNTQVTEEWPALPEVCCLVSSLINTSNRLYASTPNRSHASTSNPSPAPIFNRSHDSISHRSSVSTANRSPISTSNRSPSSAPNSSPATTSNSSHAFISNSLSRILVGGGVTLYTVTEQLYHNDIVSILNNPETSCISDMPPAKPKANKVYLVRCENSDDWKCDQYPWIQYGLKKVTIGSAVLEKKYFKIKQPGSISQQSGKRSRPVGSLEFRRTAFYFEDKKNLVLVHYEGDDNVYTPLTHGNRKERDNAPEYVRTAPSVLKATEKVVQTGGKTAMDVSVTNILIGQEKYKTYGMELKTNPSSDCNVPKVHSVRSRGNGGVLIGWNTKFDSYVKTLDDGNERIIVVEINCSPQPICLINCYLPTSGYSNTAVKYQENLDLLEIIIQKYCDSHQIILVGDMNATMLLSRRNDSDRHFSSFIDKYKLVTYPNTGATPTHQHGIVS